MPVEVERHIARNNDRRASIRSDIGAENDVTACRIQFGNGSDDGINRILGVIREGGISARIVRREVMYEDCAGRNGDLAVADLAEVSVAGHVEDHAFVHGGVTAASEDTYTVRHVEGAAVNYDRIAVGNVNAASDVSGGLDTAVKGTGVDRDRVVTHVVIGFDGAVRSDDKVIVRSVGTAVDDRLRSVKNEHADFLRDNVTVTAADDERRAAPYAHCVAVRRSESVSVQIDGRIFFENKRAVINEIRAENVVSAVVHRGDQFGQSGDAVFDHAFDLDCVNSLVIDRNAGFGSRNKVFGNDYLFHNDRSRFFHDNVRARFYVDDSRRSADFVAVIKFDRARKVQTAVRRLQIDDAVRVVGGDVFYRHVAAGRSQYDTADRNDGSVLNGDLRIVSVYDERKGVNGKGMTAQVKNNASAFFNDLKIAIRGHVSVQSGIVGSGQTGSKSLRSGNGRTANNALSAHFFPDGLVPVVSADKRHTSDRNVSDVLTAVDVDIGDSLNKVSNLAVKVFARNERPFRSRFYNGHFITADDPLTIQSDIVGRHRTAGVYVARADVELIGAVYGDILRRHGLVDADRSVRVAVPIVGDKPRNALAVKGAIRDRRTVNDVLFRFSVLHVVRRLVLGEVIGNGVSIVVGVEYSYEHDRLFGVLYGIRTDGIVRRIVFFVAVHPLIGKSIVDTRVIRLFDRGDASAVVRHSLVQDKSFDGEHIDAFRFGSGKIFQYDRIGLIRPSCNESDVSMDLLGKQIGNFVQFPSCKSRTIGLEIVGFDCRLTVEDILFSRYRAGQKPDVHTLAELDLVGLVIHSGVVVLIVGIVFRVDPNVIKRGRFRVESTIVAGSYITIAVFYLIRNDRSFFYRDRFYARFGRIDGSHAHILSYRRPSHVAVIVGKGDVSELNLIDLKFGRLRAGIVVVRSFNERFYPITTGVNGSSDRRFESGIAVVIISKNNVIVQIDAVDRCGNSNIQRTVIIHVTRLQVDRNALFVDVINTVDRGNGKVRVIARGNDDRISADRRGRGRYECLFVIRDNIGVIQLFRRAFHRKTRDNRLFAVTVIYVNVVRRKSNGQRRDLAVNGKDATALSGNVMVNVGVYRNGDRIFVHVFLHVAAGNVIIIRR